MSRLTGWCVAYLFRWFPHATAAGLRAVGHPDENSPVFATSDFSLSVKRVLRSLEGLDAWLLVVPTGGINVWCAASGGILTHDRVIDALKTSGLSAKVVHRRIVLPALCAAGVDLERVRQETGFQCRFGPVYARDIREFVRRKMTKTEAMRRASFGLKHRLDMLVSMNFIIYLVVAACVGLFRPRNLASATLLFWAAAAFLYLFLDWIPGRTGWAKATYSAVFVVAVRAGADWFLAGDPLRNWGWLVATVVLMLAIGFDLAGIASPRKSDAEAFVDRVGIRGLGKLYTSRSLGAIAIDRDRCRGCRTCRDICPVTVFGELDADQRMTLRDPVACFGCGACVTQCPEDALSLRA